MLEVPVITLDMLQKVFRNAKDGFEIYRDKSNDVTYLNLSVCVS